MALSKFMRRGVLGVAAVLVLGALATVPLLSRGEEESATMVGKAAPDVSLSTVDGKTAKISDFKGEVVLIDFWATWCPPCRLSLPHIQHLSEDKALAEKGLKVLTINAQEDKDAIQEFLDKNHYTFPVLMDSEGVADKDFDVEGLPMSFLVGRDGKIKKAWVGFYPDSTPNEIDQAIKSALQEHAPDKR